MSESKMSEQDRVEYELMMELDRLESLKEEMEELGIESLSQIDERISDLNRRLDRGN